MRSMPAPSSSQIPHTVQSFADLSRFLREDAADDGTRQLRDSLGALSQHIEAATRTRRGHLEPEAVQRSAEALAQCAREHQLQLTGMGSAWHALYEFGAYQRALRELRDAIDRWRDALHRRSAAEAECFGAFELLAWRTLGEALLLLDMYEQGDAEPGRQPLPSQPPGRPAPRRPSLLARLRGWLPGRSGSQHL